MSVYKITCAGGIYIGSTELSIGLRLSLHKMASLQFPKRKIYKFIRENGGWEATKIEIIESTENLDDLRNRENFWYDKLSSDESIEIINTRRPKIKNYDNYWREYRKKNLNKIQQYYKQKVICPICGLKVNKYYLSKHQTKSRCKPKLNDFVTSEILKVSEKPQDQTDQK